MLKLMFYSLGLPILDLEAHTLEVYTLGVYTLGVYSLGLPILDLVPHMPVLKKSYMINLIFPCQMARPRNV